MDEGLSPHDLAVLYGNRAQCYMKQRQTDQAFKDAKRSVKSDDLWYKVFIQHFLIQCNVAVLNINLLLCSKLSVKG